MGEVSGWSARLGQIASAALTSSRSLFDRERYEEVLRVAADMRAGAATERRRDPFATEWLRLSPNSVAGHETPKVGVGAVVGNDQGEILLIQRSGSGVWYYPTGWADIGYSASEVAVSEVLEETGIECEPVQLLMVFDGMRNSRNRIPLYSIVFHCRATGGEISTHPLEVLDAGWFREENLPQPLLLGEEWTSEAFAAIRGESVEPFFDRPRSGRRT